MLRKIFILTIIAAACLGCFLPGCSDEPSEPPIVDIYGSLNSALENPTLVKTLWLHDDLTYDSLPEAIGTLINMEFLYINISNLTAFPDTLATIDALTKLVAIQCKFPEFPANIGLFTSLLELNLNDNRLRTIPVSISELSRLEELYLDDNRILYLPQEISALTSLEVLYLKNNSIQSLPDEIAALKDNLKELRLENNPVEPFERLRIRALLPNTKITY